MFFALVFRVPHRTGELREWFLVFFELAVYLSLASVIWNYNKWISAFIILSSMFVFFPNYNLYSYRTAAEFFYGGVWYVFIVMAFNRKTIKYIYRVMVVSACINAMVAVFQRFNLAGYLNAAAVIGLMANPLELSGFLVFCMPAFLTLKSKYWLAVPIVGLVAAKQFLGFAALGAGAIVYLALAHRIYWIPIIVAVVLGAVWWIVLDAPGIKHRLYVWNLGIKAWWQHPILGGGLGSWKVIFSKAMNIDGKLWVRAHNEFLQMAFEMGAGAIIIIAGYLTSAFRTASKRLAIPITALSIIVAYSAASFPFHIAPTAMVAVTWLGILTIHDRDNTTDNRVCFSHVGRMGI